MAYSSTAEALADDMLGIQAEICTTFERYEEKPFNHNKMQRDDGGHSLAYIVEDGSLFERGAVLLSAINGQELPKLPLNKAMPQIEGQPFFATGVSLIFHPRNPFVPTVHFNVRYFECLDIFWFGGGMDLTPYYPFAEDCRHFHQELKRCCDKYDANYYPQFKKACDDYFYLPHRGEHRGIGGIFFNNLSTDRQVLRQFIKDLGTTFISAYAPIVELRRNLPYSDSQRKFQLYRRGRYVEFNLLHDQGTLFGLRSGGQIESILASLPPKVEWTYNWKPQPGSAEHELYQRFLIPKDWAH